MFEALVKTTMDPVNDISLAVAILKKKKKKGRNVHVKFICLRDVMGKFFGTAFL